MDYELLIMNYVSSHQPFQFFPILSNSANIGKNLKVYKGVSGRVRQVDKMLVRKDNRLAKENEWISWELIHSSSKICSYVTLKWTSGRVDK